METNDNDIRALLAAVQAEERYFEKQYALYAERRYQHPQVAELSREEYRRYTDLACNQLDRSAMHVLSLPFFLLWNKIAEELAGAVLPYCPYPKPALWLEFEHAKIGEDKLIGIWSVPETPDTQEAQFRRWQGLSPMVLRFQWVDEQFGVKVVNILENKQWEFEQMGKCETHACPVAKKTLPDVPYRIPDHHIVPVLKTFAGCNCALAARTLGNLLMALGHLLSLPLEETPWERIKITRKDKKSFSYWLLPLLIEDIAVNYDRDYAQSQEMQPGVLPLLLTLGTARYRLLLPTLQVDTTGQPLRSAPSTAHLLKVEES